MTIFHELWMRKLACNAALALALGLVCTATSAYGQEQTVAGTKSAPAAGSHAPGQDERIGTIEAMAVDIPMEEKEPPLRLSLAELMELYKVPGLGIAVIDDYKIVWAKGY